jgi:addiction module HigA family antidote
MSNYIEYNDTIAFHPGYYIKEIIDESGLTQDDFAKRLDTTPKNLSLLLRGEQSLSIDIAMKLSRMIGTSVSYWLNLQNAYDSLIAEFKSNEELVEERRIFEYLDYRYFKGNYRLPDLPRKKNEQIKQVREFLKVATLSVFTKKHQYKWAEYLPTYMLTDL